MPGAMPARYDLVTEPDRVRLALSPIRRRLLERLREPASATRLAAEAAAEHTAGRPYRLVLGSHPAPAPRTTEEPA